jgi:hypothetical protein
MIEFQHWLQRLLEEKSKGMDTSSPEYLHLCLVAWVCQRPNSDARRRFISTVGQRRGSLAARRLDADARRFWNEAKKLREMHRGKASE